MATYLEERHGIELAMDKYRQRRSATGREPEITNASPSTHRLYAFCAMLVMIHDQLSAPAQRVLAGRLRGGLQDDSGLAGLAFEMQVASDLLAKGADLICHDLEVGGFDFTAKIGDLEVEVECKTFSADVGRKIHRRRQYQIGGLISPFLAATLASGDALFVDITIPDRLAGSQLNEVAEAVRTSVSQAGDVVVPSVCRVSTKKFDPDRTRLDALFRDTLPDEEAISSLIKNFFGVDRRMFIIVARSDSLVIVALSSERPDEVVNGIYRQLAKASEQTTGTRPAIIRAHLLDMTEAQLLNLYDAQMRQQATDFHGMIGQLFRSPSRRHVHSFCFTTPGSIHRRHEITGNVSKTHLRETGPSYVLRNAQHPLRHDARLDAFS